MITRTYPSESSTISGDDLIIGAVRDRIGDRIEINRYLIAPDSEDMDTYIQSDNTTFWESSNRFWPYQVTVGTTTYSGVDNPQVINYHYMTFSSPSDLTTENLDFWLETFYLSDYEIWSAYLNADLTSLVRNEDCITEDMLILKATIDLVPSLRTARMEELYSDKTVRDGDQEYQRRLPSGTDPFKDLAKRLQDELDAMIDECNLNPVNDGYRIE